MSQEITQLSTLVNIHVIHRAQLSLLRMRSSLCSPCALDLTRRCAKMRRSANFAPRPVSRFWNGTFSSLSNKFNSANKHDGGWSDATLQHAEKFFKSTRQTYSRWKIHETWWENEHVITFGAWVQLVWNWLRRLFSYPQKCMVWFCPNAGYFWLIFR